MKHDGLLKNSFSHCDNWHRKLCGFFLKKNTFGTVLFLFYKTVTTIVR
jgi:hypothetical protein